MVGPIRMEGLFSGINYNAIIEQLVSLRSRPIVNIQNKIIQKTQVKTALTEVSAFLLSLKSSTDTLSRPSLFNTTRATTSNETVLSASGSLVASLGTYTFTVAKTATANQLISNSFASDTTAVASDSGSVSIEIGGGYLDKKTQVNFLNGQQGIDRGSIKIFRYHPEI